MKQILEVGNIAKFIDNCEKAFVIFKDKRKKLKDYDEYQKYSNLVFVGGRSTMYALVDNGADKRNVVVKFQTFSDESTLYSIVKIERGLFGTEQLNQLYTAKLQEIKEKRDEEQRLEAEEKAKNITVSKTIFREQIGKYTAAFIKMMEASTDNGEYITDVTDEDGQFPKAVFKIVLPPLNNKGGKMTINIAQFTPFGNIFAIFEPDGHANDTICNLKKKYIERFKTFLNETTV